MRHRIFFPLLLVLSATAFSASAMTTSDSKTSPGNTTSTPGGDFDISKI
ncbi:PagK family vesicle-borne virulence factor, partial [Salmonella enterica]